MRNTKRPPQNEWNAARNVHATHENVQTEWNERSSFLPRKAQNKNARMQNVAKQNELISTNET